jgi:hypothetical protein
MQTGNEVIHGTSGSELACETPLEPDLVLNPPAGHKGRVPALRNQSIPLFVRPPPVRVVSHVGQDPNPTGRREHTI